MLFSKEIKTGFSYLIVYRYLDNVQNIASHMLLNYGIRNVKHGVVSKRSLGTVKHAHIGLSGI